MFMLAMSLGRRTQVVKGEVCKTSMQRFESARRLQFMLVVALCLSANRSSEIKVARHRRRANQPAANAAHERFSRL